MKVTELEGDRASKEQSLESERKLESAWPVLP